MINEYFPLQEKTQLVLLLKIFTQNLLKGVHNVESVTENVQIAKLNLKIHRT